MIGVCKHLLTISVATATEESDAMLQIGQHQAIGDGPRGLRHDYILGGVDGSCPQGYDRVQIDECRSLPGQGVKLGGGWDGSKWVDPQTVMKYGPSEEERLSDAYPHCGIDRTPGLGCFIDGTRVYQTPAGCETSPPQASRFAVCGPPARPNPKYTIGGKDGSCPTGYFRVHSTTECAGLAGATFEGLAGNYVSKYGREDCANHFTPGVGCFVAVGSRKVYSTSAGCDNAVGRDDHLAVCAEGFGGSGSTVEHTWR